MRSLGYYSSERVTQERAAPELQPLSCWRNIAADIPILMSHAVHHSNKYAVRNGVRALNRAPRIVLRHSILFLFRRMPPDSRWIEQHIRAFQRRQARTFRIPLIPTHQRTDLAKLGIKGLVSQIAG